MRTTLIATGFLVVLGTANAHAAAPQTLTTDDPCHQITGGIEVFGQDALDRSPAVIREGANTWQYSIVFEKEPVRVKVSMGRRYFAPPKGMKVGILLDGAEVASVRFESGAWLAKEVLMELGPGKEEMIVAHSASAWMTIDSGAPGTHTLEGRLEGCEPNRPRFTGGPYRLEVRSLATPRDRAQLLQYRASEATHTAKNCTEAMKLVAEVEAREPEADAPLRLRVLCAERAGDLEGAMALMERLQARFERRGGVGELDPARMRLLREKLGSKGQKKRK